MGVIVRIFAVIGFLVVLLVGGLVAVAVTYTPAPPELPKAIVLEFDFERPIAETDTDDPFSGLLPGSRTILRDVVSTLDRAAKDDRVKGIVARIGGPSQGLGTTQELRDALARFRAAGKFAIVHAETFGEFGNGMQSYYLASAFDEVWMQPLGNLGITGVQAELTFFRDGLEKLGVTPQFDKRLDYKTAAETFAEREATPANLEMTASLLDDLFGQMVDGIAAGRELPREAVLRAIDNAPLLDREAVDAKLVDRLAYWDEVVAEAEERGRGTDGKAELLKLSTYREGSQPAAPAPDGTRIALIVGEGPITRGNGDIDPFTGAPAFGAADVAKAFEEAIDSADVKAIVFRVNSPGGSAVGSEVVRRQVARARQAGKPVIVSMGDVAGSGGYWVAMDADKIVAQPSTLTGSIGVVSGKFVLDGLTDKLGITVQTVGRGENAAIWSTAAPYDPAEEARVDAMLDDIYARFTGGVASGRNMPLDRVLEIAKGRVYTGRQALELGLVDALGGLDTAFALAREAIGLAPDSPLRIQILPRPLTPFEQLNKLMQGEVTVSDVAAGVGRQVALDMLEDYRPLLARLTPALQSLRQEPVVVAMPQIDIVSR